MNFERHNGFSARCKFVFNKLEVKVDLARQEWRGIVNPNNRFASGKAGRTARNVYRFELCLCSPQAHFADED